jgi:hypothetical protein
MCSRTIQRGARHVAAAASSSRSTPASRSVSHAAPLTRATVEVAPYTSKACSANVCVLCSTTAVRSGASRCAREYENG